MHYHKYKCYKWKVFGINTFGIRMRHEIFNTWLTEKRSTDFVIKNLKLANFDPEFYTHFEKEIIACYQDTQTLNQ